MTKKSGPRPPLSATAHEPGLLREIVHEPLAVRGFPSDEFASWLSKNIPGKGRVRVLYRYDDVSVTMLEASLIPEALEGMFY